MTLDWRAILWREWRHCSDDDYARRLYEAAYQGPLSWLKRWRVNTQDRPYAHEVEAALHSGCQASYGASFVWRQRLQKLEEEKVKSIPLSEIIANLADHHWFERFLARHLLLHRGGEAVLSLKALILTDPEMAWIAHWLLQSISAETTERLGQTAESLLCSICLVHGYHYDVSLPDEGSLTFYGCRACRQSREFYSHLTEIVAVLDDRRAWDRAEHNGSLRVNWFSWPALFDFDRVEIVHAGDEPVERLAVQIGNDTDPIRRPHYRQMICTVDPACPLSPNTMRILERIFGEVRFGQR